jgi:Family of unknown function (DUF6399)
MTLDQSSDRTASGTDPFRWDHDQIAQVFDRFSDPEAPRSQRQFAKEEGIPRSTLGYWLRQPDPPGLPADLSAFLRSSVGLAFVRRLVLALFTVFLFRGACGLRLLGEFLRLTHLDGLVASSHGALHKLALSLEADLATFASEERLRLAQEMTPKDIALVPDETFHADQPCLVAMEPTANFILVEEYQPRRDADTWTKAIQQSTDKLPVTVTLISSDQAKGLIACAETGLGAMHLPELFHGQRDLSRPLAGPLQRQKKTADKELQQAEDLAAYWRAQQDQSAAAPPRPGRKTDYDWRIDLNEAQALHSAKQVQTCEARQKTVKEAVRGLADDYHPFDSQTGASVTAEQMKERLEQRLQTLEQVTQEADLGSKADEAVVKGQRWVVTLAAVIGWFWSVARTKLEALDLSEETQQVVYEHLLPGLYWQQAAPRARTPEERQHKQALAARLLQSARRQQGALGQLSEEERADVERVSRELVGLFARSSSCVEGRNGRLSMFHHGQTRLSASRLKALTAMHNYVIKRAGGTTAAERFFGHKPRDAFDWLLMRMPDLPRPAAKRPKTTPQTAPMPA